MSVRINEVTVSLKSREKRGSGYGRVKVYPWLEDQAPGIDLFSGERHNRPHQELKKLMPEIIALAAAKKPEAFYVRGEQKIQARWSQRCGCACGCSPGFILENVNSAYDIHVNYEYVPMQ